MLKIIHPVAGAVALLTITSFWLSTVFSELFASEATVTAAKTAIPWGFTHSRDRSINQALGHG
ncbi:MAG TPA: hypothetical protein VMH36_11325 [Alphaproteobacteria bacterium]|nr:hypothetical protein [Alphaproteobacteria bacterium]